MKSVKKRLLVIISTLSICVVHAQNDVVEEQSNIQNYTPSKLLENGKWDIKWFNNLYTETERRHSKSKLFYIYSRDFYWNF
jgi:hypothetical protein